MTEPPKSARRHALFNLIVPLLLTLVVLALPAVALKALNLPGSGALIGMCGLGAMAVTMSLGWRIGLLASVFMTLTVPLAMLTADTWWAACLLMGAASFAYGMSAQRGWERALTLIPITLGFAVTSDPPASGLTARDLILAISLTVTVCALAVIVMHLLLKGRRVGGHDPISAVRARAYATLLTIATVATTAIAVFWQWGHAGGWLIMTPLIVLQPHLHDALAKSVRRAIGTTVGFVIAFGLAVILPSGWIVYLVGALFALASTVAMQRKWDYSVYAIFLTVTIVLFEGASTSITQTDLTRLGATLAGIGLVLCILVAALPFYRSANRRITQTHSMN